MFICDFCLKDKYYNFGSMSKSLGRCEECGRTQVCNNIPCGDLKPKFKTRKEKYDYTDWVDDMQCKECKSINEVKSKPYCQVVGDNVSLNGSCSEFK